MSQRALAVCFSDVWGGGIDRFGGQQEEGNSSWKDKCLSPSAPLTHC